MLHILQAMVRWLAPVLSFTAEEIWQVLPAAGRQAEIGVPHGLACFPGGAGRAHVDWDALIALRQAVLRELEKLREAGTIGAPLEAEVDVLCAARGCARATRTLGGELRFLTITSAARVHTVQSEPEGAVAAEAGSAVIPGCVAEGEAHGWQQVRALLAPHG